LFIFKVLDHEAVLGGAVEKGGIELVFVCVKLEKELQHQVVDALRIREFPIDFVYDDDRLETVSQGFAKHKSSLGLRSVFGVHQKQYAIHHFHNPLNFSTEIGVSGSVDDVDGLSFPVDGSVFGLNRDAFLPLQVHGVHRPFFRFLILAVNAALLHQAID